MRYCPAGSPLTTFEPIYNPRLWNDRADIRTTHNCYSYAMNVQDPRQVENCPNPNESCDTPFHQPGLSSGHKRHGSRDPKTCPNMFARIQGDNPSVEMTSFEGACPHGSSKIAMIVDENEDFHFLRQDSNRFWSHKPGGRPVINKDARDHLIWNPELANYNYTAVEPDAQLNYDIFCGYMCVPRTRPLYITHVGGRRKGGATPSRVHRAPRGAFSTTRRRDASLKPTSR